MSDLENARKNLQISGYEHPTNSLSNTKLDKYKTFDSENNNKNYIESSKNYGYLILSDEEKKEVRKSLFMSCPKCGDQALYECDCEYKDKQCSKGHVWYITSSGKINNGDPHDPY